MYIIVSASAQCWGTVVPPVQSKCRGMVEVASSEAARHILVDFIDIDHYVEILFFPCVHARDFSIIHVLCMFIRDPVPSFHRGSMIMVMVGACEHAVL